ncbi:MAG: alpha amylase C-terminal domain-containing protein, partial [Verrucomicrobiales bacterium]
YYGSFGYHVSSFFAPSSRFGTPEDLKYLVDTAHGAGLTVLMDIVHSHAVKNLAEGLNRLDGSEHQYFHPDDRGEHPQWDSKCFDYGRPEVRHFLLSNLRYWIEEFRFDGFRFDGVTSMLYWHRGTEAFGSRESYFGPAVDEDAVLYLKLATTLIHSLKKNALIIAEDMSGMPGLCQAVTDGGIGFTHRLAMGIPDYWIKLLKHQKDEDWNLDQLWSTLTNRNWREKNIAYAESHDQALVGDKTLAFWLMDQEMYWHMSLLQELHPTIDRGIALHKLIRLLTFTLGGEGWLNFIGNEFGHPEWLDFPREGNGWSYQHCRRQWSLVDDENLRYQQLNNFDRALQELDRDHGVLNTLPANQKLIHNQRKLLVVERNNLIFAFNLHPTNSYADLEIPTNQDGTYQLILDTDRAEFGGHQRLRRDNLHPAPDHRTYIYLPSRTALVLKKKG